MRALKDKTGAAIVLITHDLGVVAEMAQRVVVMYAGRKVEEAPVAQLFAQPRHPYTQGLLNSIPRLKQARIGAGTRLAEIPGMVPSLLQEPVGCIFEPRCAYATERAAAPNIRRSKPKPRAILRLAGSRIVLQGAEMNSHSARCCRCRISPSTSRSEKACSRG